MTELVHAPWTPEQVEKVAAWQDGQWGHPFTCERDVTDVPHRLYQAVHGGDFGALEATSDGLRCPVCGYVQPWVWSWILSE